MATRASPGVRCSTPNLVRDFVDEILDVNHSGRNQGNFEDGAWVQEVINAVELSFHQRRWVDLPLPTVSEGL